jgi:hypothetical protein
VQGYFFVNFVIEITQSEKQEQRWQTNYIFITQVKFCVINTQIKRQKLLPYSNGIHGHHFGHWVELLLGSAHDRIPFNEGAHPLYSFMKRCKVIQHK